MLQSKKSYDAQYLFVTKLLYFTWAIMTWILKPHKRSVFRHLLEHALSPAKGTKFWDGRWLAQSYMAEAGEREEGVSG